MNFFLKCNQYIYILNNYFALPAIIIFFGIALILTIKLGFPQFRFIRKFIHLIKNKNFDEGLQKIKTKKTISSLQAMFSAMQTTIGMGNIVGPPMAIAIGGPGALFWLLIYIFFGSVLKLVEVTFAVYSRSVSAKGNIIGGPFQYLKLINPFLGYFYATLTVCLFTIWSSVQVNTISCIAASEGIRPFISGLVSVFLLLIVVFGGVKRVGYFASRLVPFMLIIYLSFSIFIILQNIHNLTSIIKTVIKSAFSFRSIGGSMLGFTFVKSIREGIYKGIFITESGIGTSSIAHSFANVKKPLDQGILAMYSSFADIILCVLSGLVTLLTGIWKTSELSNILIYKAFKIYSPLKGSEIILGFIIFLFVFTSLIGNTFNGSMSFASLAGYKHIKLYYLLAAFFAFFGAVADMHFLWNLMDLILILVAIPNILGILFLSFKYKEILTVDYLRK